MEYLGKDSVLDSVPSPILNRCLSHNRRCRPHSLATFRTWRIHGWIDAGTPLINILFIAVCAVLGGAEGWRSIETFGHAKKDWFGRHIELPEGEHPVPSDDTYRRTISRLDPEVFEAMFHRWVASIAKHVDGEIIALDGKTVRGSSIRDASTIDEHGGSLKALHLVSA